MLTLAGRAPTACGSYSSESPLYHLPQIFRGAESPNTSSLLTIRTSDPTAPQDPNCYCSSQVGHGGRQLYTVTRNLTLLIFCDILSLTNHAEEPQMLCLDVRIESEILSLGLLS